MSQRILDFYDNLVSHLAGDATLPELEVPQVLLVTGPDDEEQVKAIDQFVQRQVMRTKGLAVVIFDAGGQNAEPEVRDSKLLADMAFEVRLFIHPQKWGKTYDPTKREALVILEALVSSLHGAEVNPAERGCHDAVRVNEFAPVPDPEFWAWNITAQRALVIP